jgi:hypothetical protein
MMSRSDSPWYPTARLFRQQTDGDWGGVFREIGAAVMDELAKQKTVPPPGRLAQPEVPISWGELIDKITILEIKVERLPTEQSRLNARTELKALAKTAGVALATKPDIHALKDRLRLVNEALWEVEDALREKEAAGDFGNAFVQLARAVYRHNDDRAAIKREINLALQSALIEEKSYKDYHA